MSSEKSLTPQIRFKGFTEAWEQRKLGELGQTYNGLTGKSKDDFGHGQAQYITYMNVFSNPICNLALTEKIEVDQKQNEVEIGDVFFTTSSETPEEVGMSSVLTEKQGITYLNSFCFGYRPLQKINLNYLAYMLRSNPFRKNITFLAQGISRYNISKTKVMDVSVHLPTAEEQYIIGSFFKNLDSLITLHQRKLDALKKIKSALLEKMFPKDGSNIPEIRFTGFTEAWEQRKLGDLSKILGGFAWSSKEYTPKGEFLVITISNVTGDYFIDDSIGNRINLEKESNYILASGDILISLTGNVGRVSKMGSSKGVLNQRVAKIIPSKKIEIEFLFQLMRDTKFELKMIESGQGAAQKNISNNNILSYSTNIPNISEQKRIGHTFKKIDSLITLHQRKLDALKKIKSALLEKMFV